jgi:hypothetical protein
MALRDETVPRVGMAGFVERLSCHVPTRVIRGSALLHSFVNTVTFSSHNAHWAPNTAIIVLIACGVATSIELQGIVNALASEPCNRSPFGFSPRANGRSSIAAPGAAHFVPIASLGMTTPTCSLLSRPNHSRVRRFLWNRCFPGEVHDERRIPWTRNVGMG